MEFPNLLSRQLRTCDRKRPSFKLERAIKNCGKFSVCGIDEAGRGALAGPLISAAIILPSRINLKVMDSKKLKVDERKVLLGKIVERAISWSVGIASTQEINDVGIQEATYISYLRAIKLLNPQPDFLLLDFYKLPNTNIDQFSITKGDEISASIAAASIIAKVTRDNLMEKLSTKEQYTKYGWGQNCGYGTRDHLEKIRKFGPCDIHRKNYKPIDEMLSLRFDYLK